MYAILMTRRSKSVWPDERLATTCQNATQARIDRLDGFFWIAAF